MALAVILGAGTALANARSTKAAPTLYYWTGTSYAPAGIEGYDFICEWSQFGSCTFTYDSTTNTYTRYKYGKIAFLR
jgi:hypothetical protein